MYQESKYTKYQILYGICVKVIILDIISRCTKISDVTVTGPHAAWRRLSVSRVLLNSLSDCS